MAFSAAQALPYLNLITGCGIVGLGIWTVLRERGSRASFFHWTMSFACGIWLLSYYAMFRSFDDAQALWWAKTAHIGVIAIGPAVYTFAVFILRTSRNWLLISTWGTSAVFLGIMFNSPHFIRGFYHYSWGRYPMYGAWSIPFLIYFALLAGLTFYEFYRADPTQWSASQDQRARFYARALLIGYLAAIDYLPNLGIAFPPVGGLAILAFIILSAQFIQRFRLSDLVITEAALRQSEERFLRVVDEIRDHGIFMTDLDGRIVSWNQGASRLFGYTAREVLGERCSYFQAKTDESAIDFDHLLNVARAEERAEAEGWLQTKTQKLLYTDIVISGLHNRNGQINGFVILSRDRTLRKQSEDALLRAQEKLVATNEELEAFTYSVSHDLRAPLRAVVGFSEILTDEQHPNLSDDAHQYLRLIRKNAQHMAKLIEALLSLSHLGRKPLERHRIDMNALVRDVVDDLHAQGPYHTTAAHIEQLAPAWGDEALIKQVWINLLANAFKFSAPKTTPRVVVSYRATPTEHVYSVQDNGVGFDMQYAAKLFNVFQRLHKATEFEGTGAGLAIVNRIVHRHDGRVWAESKPGSTTTFYFTLPVAPSEM